MINFRIGRAARIALVPAAALAVAAAYGATSAHSGGVSKAASGTRESRPQAIAIGLLHAYANPAHERRLERALARLGVPVTRSSAVCPEVREYERLSTTVANAYLIPRVASYLTRLSRGTPASLEIVLSHGGTTTPARAAREPVTQLLSGPAGGLKAARDVARACGFERALTLDIGGTSTDCGFVAGELPRRRAREVAGFPIQLPSLDLHTIGAGGGSIAAVDAGGLLHVGPQSAGAVPHATGAAVLPPSPTPWWCSGASRDRAWPEARCGSIAARRQGRSRRSAGGWGGWVPSRPRTG